MNWETLNFDSGMDRFHFHLETINNNETLDRDFVIDSFRCDPQTIENEAKAMTNITFVSCLQQGMNAELLVGKFSH